MDLYFNQNFIRPHVRPLKKACRSRAFLMTIAALSSLTVNCRNSDSPKTPNSNNMDNTTESRTNPNDPLAIHRRAIIVDMHADTTQRLVDEQVDLSQRLPD